MRVSVSTDRQKLEVALFSINHTAVETMERFKIGHKKLGSIRESYGLMQKGTLTRLSENQEKSIAEYSANHSIAETSAKFGVHTRTVSRIKKNYGLPDLPVGKKSRFTQSDFDEWQTLRDSGETVEVIAEKYGTCISYISRKTRKTNTRQPKRKGYKPQDFGITSYDSELIKDLLSSGLSLVEVAEKFECPVSIIKKVSAH